MKPGFKEWLWAIFGVVFMGILIIVFAIRDLVVKDGEAE